MARKCIPGKGGLTVVIPILLHAKEHPPHAAAAGARAPAQQDRDTIVDRREEPRGDLRREEALHEGAHLRAAAWGRGIGQGVDRSIDS